MRADAFLNWLLLEPVWVVKPATKHIFKHCLTIGNIDELFDSVHILYFS